MLFFYVWSTLVTFICMSNTLSIARLTFHSRSSTVFVVGLRVEICFAFNVNEIWIMYITLYIISPICNVKELIEWFSFECRKTKTKVITLANHIGHRQYIEPIKTRSNYMWLTQSAGKCMRARHNWLWFYF